MYDYHVHPNYSIDADGRVEEFCETALKRGLKEIAFATHLDTDLETEDCYVRVKGKLMDTLSGKWLEDYEATVRSAGEKYESRGLKVLLGVEVDYIPGVEEILPEQFYSTDFDIILGATHLVDHIAISAEDRAPEAFRRYSVEDIGEKYYSLLLEATDTGLFDIMAHLDLYRRFGQLYYGEAIQDVWKTHLKEIAKVMNRRNVGFEVNTSPLRREQNNPMPATPIIQALFKAGVKTVTVGSDAHSPKDVGTGIEKAMELLYHNGYREITGFEHRKHITYDLSPVIDQAKENYV